MNLLFEAFLQQSLCAALSLPDARALFSEMVANTRACLAPYYPLDRRLP